MGGVIVVMLFVVVDSVLWLIWQGAVRRRREAEMWVWSFAILVRFFFFFDGNFEEKRSR
jgi:hypothetical protein